MKVSLHSLVILVVFTLFANACWAQQPSESVEYRYDALGRLILVIDSANGDATYDYDPAGNRRNVTFDGEGVSTNSVGNSSSNSSSGIITCWSPPGAPYRCDEGSRPWDYGQYQYCIHYCAQ